MGRRHTPSTPRCPKASSVTTASRPTCSRWGERRRVSHRPDLDYRFNVVNASEINAYALPGGKISITRGLLSKMENEAQLGLGAGHEVGHVTARHAAAGYTRQVFAEFSRRSASGCSRAPKSRGADVLAQGGLLAAPRPAEVQPRSGEAVDDLGLGYMNAGRLQPRGPGADMEILLASQQREPSAVESMFQSHPLSSERLATTQAKLPSSAPGAPDPDRPRCRALRSGLARLRKWPRLCQEDEAQGSWPRRGRARRSSR